MNHRAYSFFEIKSVDEEKRIIRGIATTPTVDRVGDVVEPLGVKFKNPLPFLWQHDSSKPIGLVEFGKPTKDGIAFTAEIPNVADDGKLKERVDEAWQSIKLRLVRAVSIGFRAIEYAFIEGTGGIRFIESEVYELSAVTIPAQSEAIITSFGKNMNSAAIAVIKSFDTSHSWQKAASGRSESPGASGLKIHTRDKGNWTMKTIEQQLRDLEATRATKAERMKELFDAAPDGQIKSLEDADRTEYRTLAKEIGELDQEIDDLNGMLVASKSARPIIGKDAASGSLGRDVRKAPAEVVDKPEPGIRFARYVRCMTLAHKMHRDVVNVAEELYGQRDGAVVKMIKAAGTLTPALSTTNASELIGNEGGFADFAEYLRKQTIVGRFGQGGIPALRGVPFRVPLMGQTGKGTAYWVGEGKGKPLTKQTFGRTEMTPLKVAVITAATMEVLRDSSPSAERLIRDDLTAALVERIDLSFIDPDNSGVSTVEPASITDDIAAMTHPSSGATAADVRSDARNAIQKFIAADNPLTTGVWIMSSQRALALSMMVNDLGNLEFPGITMNGGTFMGLPVITSEYVDDYVVLVNAGDIYLGDEGGITIDMSTEASLEMRAGDDEGPTQDSASNPPVASTMVSMFGTNSVAFRAERTINWQRRRDTAVALITDVEWGVEGSGS